MSGSRSARDPSRSRLRSDSLEAGSNPTGFRQFPAIDGNIQLAGLPSRGKGALRHGNSAHLISHLFLSRLSLRDSLLVLVFCPLVVRMCPTPSRGINGIETFRQIV